MRFLLLPAAALLTATSTSAADDPKGIQPQLPPAADISSKTQAEEPNLLRPRLSRVIDPIPEHCTDIPTIAARKRGRALSPDKLADLPPGEAYHAVYRRGSDGCIDPVLVNGYNAEGR